MILAIDIGGTDVKMGILDRNGSVINRHAASVSFDNYRTPIIDTVVSEAKKFLCQLNVIVEGIGVSATGQIDDNEGVVIGTNGKIPQYEGTCIKKIMEQQFNVPVWVLNDANAAILGECFTGRAKGMNHVIMLTLGTGVGGGMVLNGKLYGGKQGIAGELGHFTLKSDGEKCSCGKRGCMESYCSTTALIKRCEKATGETGLNGKIIFSRGSNGDKAIIKELDEWINDIAEGITGLVHIFNPEMVLIGGGVSSQENLLMKPLREKVLSGVMPRFAEGLQVERAVLGNDAGMIGAAKFFMDRQEENE